MNGRGGPEIRLVDGWDDVERLADVLGRVWGVPDGGSVLGPDLMRAIAHAGGYVAAAVDPDGTMVAGSVGFHGRHGGRPSLHSHVTGVLPTHEHTGIGRSLKQHQRRWAHSHGVECITWTFDPLVRRNAWFNLQTLGAQVEEYLVDFYGALGDDINGDDASDRLLAVWWVDGDRATAAAEGRLRAPADGDLVDAARRLTVTADDQPCPTRSDDGATTLVVEIPRDIVAIRRRDRALAERWRHAVRAELGAALHEGWSIAAVCRDGGYVLRHEGES